MLKHLFAVVVCLALLAMPTRTAPLQNVGTTTTLPSEAGPGVIGYASATDTTAATMAAAPGATNANFLYWAQCINTSASTADVALIKGGTTTYGAIPCTPGVAVNQPIYFYPPLRVGINATFTMGANAGATTNYFVSEVRVARAQ